jgi:hypothetical protein
MISKETQSPQNKTARTIKKRTFRKSHEVPQLKPHQFKPGQSGNPNGRGKASRTKLSESFILALQEKFNTHGEQVLDYMITNEPVAFIELIASIVPKNFQVEMTADDNFVDLMAFVSKGGTRNPTLALPAVSED